MPIVDWIQKLLGGQKPPPRMDEREVVQAAKKLAAEKQLLWEEPVQAEFDGETGVWRLCTAAGSRGGNLRIEISDRTGEVIACMRMPR